MPNEQHYATSRHALVVGELAYKPIAITQFRPFVVYGSLSREGHIYTLVMGLWYHWVRKG